MPCQVASKKLSQESLGRQKSPHDDKQKIEDKSNRQGSPAGGGSGPTCCEDEDEEEGNHDTITSLAGAKMMQWYHKALTGSRKSSNVSLNQVLFQFFARMRCACSYPLIFNIQILNRLLYSYHG